MKASDFTLTRLGGSNHSLMVMILYAIAPQGGSGLTGGCGFTINQPVKPLSKGRSGDVAIL